MSEIEEKAKEHGWVPQEEWKGDSEAWRPAEEFLERGEKILPIVKKRLKDEIEAVKRELNTAIKMRDKEFEKIKEDSYKKAKAEYETKLRELSEKEFEAAQGNDFDQWQKIQGEKQNLKPPEEPKVENVVTPVFEEWKKNNDWYETDEDLTDLAYAKAGKLQQRMEKGEVDRLPEDEFYREVEKQVKAAMPHKFTNPNREKASVTDSGHEPAPGGKNSWNNVPASAKATFKRQAEEWERRGKKLDRDEWVKTYFEG
jgi:hypothetical protein